MDRKNCKHENARFAIDFSDGWNNPSRILGNAGSNGEGDTSIIGNISVTCSDCKIRIDIPELTLWVKYDITSEIQEALLEMTKKAENIADGDERMHTFTF